MSKAFDKLIYLASPYSHSDNDVIARRVLEVQDATARLIERGHLIFSPIVHSHHIASQVTFEPTHNENSDLHNGTTWLDYDRAMINKADELWILRLNGHTRSKGVHAELYHALDRGIPVKYINYPDLSVFGDVGICTVAPNGLPDEWNEMPDIPAADYGKVNTWGKPFPTGPMYVEGEKVRVTDERFGHRFSIGTIGTLTRHDSSSWRVDAGGDYWYLKESEFEKYSEIPEQTPTIIGLTGHAQSGKDTAGKYLVENHGFTRIGLADAVKDCLYALNPRVPMFSDQDNYNGGFPLQAAVNSCGWDSCKNDNGEIRQLLQRMGTEVGRQIISETVWLDIASRKIKELGPSAKVVITDIRFPNEAEWVRSLGGKVVRINRPGFGPVNDHASDARLSDDLVDAEVNNAGTLDSFHLNIWRQVTPYVS